VAFFSSPAETKQQQASRGSSGARAIYSTRALFGPQWLRQRGCPTRPGGSCWAWAHLASRSRPRRPARAAKKKKKKASSSRPREMLCADVTADVLVPGRVALVGEHADWLSAVNGARALPFARRPTSNVRVCARARRSVPACPPPRLLQGLLSGRFLRSRAAWCLAPTFAAPGRSAYAVARQVWLFLSYQFGGSPFWAAVFPPLISPQSSWTMSK